MKHNEQIAEWLVQHWGGREITKENALQIVLDIAKKELDYDIGGPIKESVVNSDRPPVKERGNW